MVEIHYSNNLQKTPTLNNKIIQGKKFMQKKEIKMKLNNMEIYKYFVDKQLLVLICMFELQNYSQLYYFYFVFF